MAATPSFSPIACSLSVQAAGDRRADWDALLARSLVRRTSIRDGIRVDLRNTPGVHAELKRLVAAERECCPFMTMSVEETDRLVVLTATAPAPAGPILHEMLAGEGSDR